MRRTIVGIFSDLGEAYDSIKGINEKELANNQISIVAPAKPNFKEEFSVELDTNPIKPLSSFDGILVQGSVMHIPSVGDIAAAGPIAGALGQGDKAIADCLQYYGVDMNTAKDLQTAVRDGQVLTVIETNSKKAREVANILKSCGGGEVEIWSTTIDKPLDTPK